MARQEGKKGTQEGRRRRGKKERWKIVFRKRRLRISKQKAGHRRGEERKRIAKGRESENKESAEGFERQ